MEHIYIAALRPNTDALDSKHITAVVTLIWPYSSSQRQFALLLAEPDLGLRRKKGQVRARFSATSARALAATGVGIGDEVQLSLHGAQFVQDGAVGTPGKSIDWELAYTQTLAISVRRHGAEIANLDLVDAAPTPAPRSPVKKAAAAATEMPSPVPQWSSPAFLKRARLSNGPFLEQPAFDLLADAHHEGHDKKRRRKSYRDWTAWTYTTRTPSPEKDHIATQDDDDTDGAMSSPSRPPQLPKTPISPSRTEPTSVAVEAQDDSEYLEETTIADSAEGDTTVDDGELRKVYAPVSASPQHPHRNAVPHASSDGAPPPDSQYDFGGDTELNTEDEAEDDDATVPDVEEAEVSATEVATELEDEQEKADEEPPQIEFGGGSLASATDEDSSVEVDRAVAVQEFLAVAMPPPTLPILTTDFAAPSATDLSTPIGKEPSSPNLKAVDSATLPMPSPFPGDQAGSYFENALEGQQQAPLDGPSAQEESVIDADADYILENSFFSSISSSRAGGLHQDHETAFTPVRFTFGMDGAGWSRPLELSSPPPEHAPVKVIDETTISSQVEVAGEEGRIQSAAPVQVETIDDVTDSSLFGTFDGDVTSSLKPPVDSAEPRVDVADPPAEPPFAISVAEPAEPAELVPRSSNVVLLSSDVESDGTKEDVEDAVMVDREESQSPEAVEDAVLPDPQEDHSSEEETNSESEEEIESESEQETDSEVDVVEAQQTSPDPDRGHTEARDSTLNAESEAGDEQSPLPKEDAPFSTQASAAISEVVDLGSPLEDEVSDADEDGDISVEPEQAGEDPTDPGSNDSPSAAQELQNEDPNFSVDPTDDATVPEHPDFDNPSGMDVTQESAVVLSSSPDPLIRKPASIAIPDTFEEPPNLPSDDWEPQLGMDEPLPFIEDRDASADIGVNPSDVALETADVTMHSRDTQADIEESDVKMESVEDDSPYLISQSQDVPQESTTGSATELLIIVPEDGQKLGQLHTKSVPATAPARNTRSKAKAAASPTVEDGYVSRVSTSMRRTRSKASFDSTNRDTPSPTQTSRPFVSTVTPSRTRPTPQTSPYSLRSQSKNLSPEKNVTASQAPVRKSPRKLPRRDSDFDIVPSQIENRDLFGSMFEPSQELGFGYSQLSQGRYSDVGVKDSEEDTSHSEASMSTIRYSDDDGLRASLSVVEVAENLEHVESQMKPPPQSLQSHRQTRSTSRSIGQQSEVSPVQPPHSPRRSPRLTRSTFSPTPSPRVVRTTRAAAQISSPIPEVRDEDKGEEETPKGKDQPIAYPLLPTEGENDTRSSPSAPAPASAQQSDIQDSNLLTPDDTQQATLEQPPSFQPRQPEQSFLLTPDFTQQTSASATLRSFDIPLPGVETQPAPRSPSLRTSPRHKPVAAKARSPSPTQQSSPNQHSSDAISPEDPSTALTINLEPPTIGLSTPLAYYTPLRDLIYFLNRSSQFHSSSNPDTLALCTRATSTPSKAKTGPRHWTTTLAVTDLSIWPAVRTVNVFRAYASALLTADIGDVVLLRAFKVQSQKREAQLRSADESSWCVWRFGKRVWGKKGGRYGELKAREDVKGPVVERGPGEWVEVERLRGWFVGVVGPELEGKSRRDGEESGVGGKEVGGGEDGNDAEEGGGEE